MREPPVWRQPIPATIDTDHCLGCGKELPAHARTETHRDLTTPDGRVYYVCPGRSRWEPSVPCLRLALERIHHARICAGCGEEAEAEWVGIRYRHRALCDRCRKLLTKARTLDEELRAAKAKTLEEARDGLVTDFLRNVAQALYRNESHQPKWSVLAEELCETDDFYHVRRTVRGRLFMALRQLFGQAINEAYARGVDHGSSLLRALNNGRLALNDFDGEKKRLIKRQEEKVRNLAGYGSDEPFDPMELFETPEEPDE